jgi:membrane-associated phospholipid phosphatase
LASTSSTAASGEFLFVASLIALGRVVVGAHYLTDVLASLVVSAIAAWIVVRFGKRALDWLSRLLERATDPLVTPVHRRVRRSNP